MSFADYAQSFVDATSQLVSGKTINIMNESGCIIASSDKTRIGTFHAGAYKVLSTRQEMIITRDTAPSYQGAKEGYNLPIKNNGQIVGVIGVTGAPEEVKDLANLLCVYATQYFQIRSDAKKDKLHSEIRLQILLNYIYGKNIKQNSVQMDNDMLGLKITLPVRIMIIASPDPASEYLSYSRLEKYLIEQHILHPLQDAYGGLGNNFAVLLSRQTPEAFHKLNARLEIFLKNYRGVRAVFGSQCTNYEEIPASYQEAMFLIKSGASSSQISNIDIYSSKLDYFMELLANKTAAAYTEKAGSLLTESLGEDGMDLSLKSAAAYFAYDRSVQKAAEYLNIHKNTLLHRMGKLYKLLHLEEETAFTQEFFIRLIINRLRSREN